MREVPMPQAPTAPYEQVLGAERMAHLSATAARVGRGLGARTIWNVNSTAEGGGVAELLHALGPLARALGLDVRWLVIDGDPEFFAITKRLAMLIYGSPGDGGRLGPEEREHYQRELDRNAAALVDFVKADDIVVLHDPQPAGLADRLRRLGVTVVWRCHIGCDTDNEYTRAGWAFLRPYVECADATVFHIDTHVPDWAPRPWVIPPSIDPCGPKNMALDAEDGLAVLARAGVLAGPRLKPVTVPVPVGPPVEVCRHATVVRDGPPPPATVPMVVQLSRWDRLKDMIGVLEAFVAAEVPDSYLTLAGPEVDQVADDPEAGAQFDECRRVWSRLAPADRRRVQLLCLPMADPRENAVLVNALQRHATVVLQKSLAEGFGLTATEAMWKGPPVLASATGGLREQITDGESGLLVGDPSDIDAAAAGIRRLLVDRELAAGLGSGARHTVGQRFLSDRHLLAWTELIENIATAEVT
jgi:trehalose synthase